VRNAVDIVAEVSPVLTAGDALDQLRAAVARARKSAPKATVVVWSPAVLVYLDPSRRAEFQKYCRRAKIRWISLDGRNVLAGMAAAATERGLDGEFLLTLDGEPIAEVDALGRSAKILNTAGLSPDDMDLLEFERVHWGALRSKESLVRTHWGLPLVRYYQRLYAIMESAAARRYDPVLVRAFDESRDSANLRSR
jgi:hypothetical protein